VREALGIRRTVVSGGGSLAPHLDEFFEMAGLTVSRAEPSRAGWPDLSRPEPSRADPSRPKLGWAGLQALSLLLRATCGSQVAAANARPACPCLPLQVLNGWGLTETSPVLACRRTVPGGNVRGTAGLPIPGTQLRVVDPETLQELAPGEQVGGGA
jgi:long-subunit acyl-CoA synthetase (AMP-forming)